MKELQIILPTTHTEEEVQLKELHEKIKDLRRRLNDRSGGDHVRSDKASKKSVKQAELATEEVKKKIQSGAITVKKVNEKSSFKRSARQMERRVVRLSTSESINSINGEDGELVDPNESAELTSPRSTSSRANSFDYSAGRRNTETRGPTVYVRGDDLQTDSLNKAFEKFGQITRVNLNENKRCAFIQFSNESEATAAVKEMDGQTVSDCALRVSFAFRQGAQQQKRGPDERGRGQSESEEGTDRKIMRYDDNPFS